MMQKLINASGDDEFTTFYSKKNRRAIKGPQDNKNYAPRSIHQNNQVTPYNNGTVVLRKNNRDRLPRNNRDGLQRNNYTNYPSSQPGNYYQGGTRYGQNPKSNFTGNSYQMPNHYQTRPMNSYNPSTPYQPIYEDHYATYNTNTGSVYEDRFTDNYGSYNPYNQVPPKTDNLMTSSRRSPYRGVGSIKPQQPSSQPKPLAISNERYVPPTEHIFDGLFPIDPKVYTRSFIDNMFLYANNLTRSLEIVMDDDKYIPIVKDVVVHNRNRVKPPHINYKYSDDLTMSEFQKLSVQQQAQLIQDYWIIDMAINIAEIHPLFGYVIDEDENVDLNPNATIFEFKVKTNPNYQHIHYPTCDNEYLTKVNLGKFTHEYTQGITHNKEDEDLTDEEHEELARLYYEDQLNVHRATIGEELQVNGIASTKTKLYSGTNLEFYSMIRAAFHTMYDHCIQPEFVLGVDHTVAEIAELLRAQELFFNEQEIVELCDYYVDYVTENLAINMQLYEDVTGDELDGLYTKNFWYANFECYMY